MAGASRGRGQSRVKALDKRPADVCGNESEDETRSDIRCRDEPSPGFEETEVFEGKGGEGGQPAAKSDGEKCFYRRRGGEAGKEAPKSSEEKAPGDVYKKRGPRKKGLTRGGGA